MPAKQPFWGTRAELYDQVTLDGLVLPCAGDPKAKLVRKLDKRSPAGKHGAKLRDKGDDVTQVEVTFRLWTEAQYDTYQDLLGRVKRRRDPRAPHGGRRPAAIYHPCLAEMGIAYVYVHEVGSLARTGRPQEREATWTFEQYDPDAAKRGTGSVTRRVVPGLPPAVFEPFVGGASRPTDRPPSATEAGP